MSPPEQLEDAIAFFSVDVSFISLHHIFPVARAVTTPDAVGGLPGQAAVLRRAGKRWAKTAWSGDPRHPTGRCCTTPWDMRPPTVFAVRGLDFSPVKGPEGNIEYLMFVEKSAEPCTLGEEGCGGRGGRQPPGAGPLT